MNDKEHICDKWCCSKFLLSDKYPKPRVQTLKEGLTSVYYRHCHIIVHKSDNRVAIFTLNHD